MKVIQVDDKGLSDGASAYILRKMEIPLDDAAIIVVKGRRRYLRRM